MESVVNAFYSLPVPPVSGTEGIRFSAQAIPGGDSYRIAKDTEGRPALLISGTGKATRLLNYRLENLEVVPSVNCAISFAGGAQERGTFSLIRCVSDDAVIHDHFLRSIASIIAAIGPNPSSDDISYGITKLVELFQLMVQPPHTSA